MVSFEKSFTDLKTIHVFKFCSELEKNVPFIKKCSHIQKMVPLSKLCSHIHKMFKFLIILLKFENYSLVKNDIFQNIIRVWNLTKCSDLTLPIVSRAILNQQSTVNPLACHS